VFLCVTNQYFCVFFCLEGAEKDDYGIKIVVTSADDVITDEIITEEAPDIEVG
jgi:hypothetical protein